PGDASPRRAEPSLSGSHGARMAYPRPRDLSVSAADGRRAPAAADLARRAAAALEEAAAAVADRPTVHTLRRAGRRRARGGAADAGRAPAAAGLARRTVAALDDPAAAVVRGTTV